jgi:hypothetical protein
VQQRGAGYEVEPAPPAEGFAPTLHRPRPRTDPEAIRADLDEGERRLQAGDPTSAVNLAERAIRKAPSSIEAHALLLRAQHALAAATPMVDVSREPEGTPAPEATRFPAWVLPASGAGALAAAGLVAALLGAFSGGEPRPAEPRREIEKPAARPRVVPPVTVPASPSPAKPPAVTEIAIDPQLERARGLVRQGAVPAAIDILEPLLTQTRDGRVRTAIDAALREVTSRIQRARAAAIGVNARERAAAQFVVADESAQLMARASKRNDYREAARIGLVAAAQFDEAAAEATRLAEAEDKPASTPAPSTPEPPVAIAPPAPAGDLKPEPPPVSNLPAPTPAPEAVPALDREKPAILAALNNYRSAYRNASVPEMIAVFPELPRERRQAYERAFKNKRDCPALDVQFGAPEIFLSGEDKASVTVLSTYICKPTTAQRDPEKPQTDVFQMRKAGDRWVITGMGAMK